MANLQLQMKRETERLEAMRAHLDPNRKLELPKEDKISPKPPQLPSPVSSVAEKFVKSENHELSGAAAVHKMAQLESNFLAHAQSLSGGIQNIFGAKAAAAAAAFAGLASQQNPMADRLRTEESKRKNDLKNMGQIIKKNVQTIESTEFIWDIF